MTPLRSLGHATRSRLPANELHLPELHLPDLTRDGIARSLSDVHLPDLDLSGLERPRIELPSLDLGKAIAGAAAAAHIGQRARRPRWPLAVAGLVVAGLAGWAILSQDAQRVRLTRGAQAIRERISAIRSDLRGRSDVDPGNAIAFSAADTAPIETSQFTDSPTVEATDYPAGLGSTVTPDAM